MSKLREALQQKRRGEGRLLGFGTAARAKHRALLLGTLADSTSEAAEGLAAGADFATVRAVDTDAAAAAGGLAGLAGADFASLTVADIASLGDAGVDFVIAVPETTAAEIVEGDLGLVLAADEAWDDTRLRALAPLALDAVLVRTPVEGLTLARRISLARVAILCAAPLLVTVTPAARSAELAALRESGAGGVVVAGDTPASELAQLIEQIEAIPTRSPRRGGEGDFAIVPAASATTDDGEFEDGE